MITMSKRLFASKTATLVNNYTYFPLELKLRANESKINHIKINIGISATCSSLQLAAERMSFNLGPTYDKAKTGYRTDALKLLREKHQQLLKDLNTAIKNYKTTYADQEQTIPDIQYLFNTKTFLNNLNAYFTVDYTNSTPNDNYGVTFTKTQRTGNQLENCVKQQAALWRKIKQSSKEESATQMEQLTKICKHVMQYENWFDDHSKEAYLLTLNPKQLQNLKSQNDNLWKKYHTYCINQIQYLHTNYPGHDPTPPKPSETKEDNRLETTTKSTLLDTNFYMTAQWNNKVIKYYTGPEDARKPY